MNPHTIVAQATPPGRGGVSIVRVSGPQVKEISLAILNCIPTPRTAHYSSFTDKNANTIDQGIALFFPNPHSFTSEDVLELHGHGGPVIVSLLIQRILELGARLARPGEFSERAFLNGKIDLAQAEAIADLIHASTEQAARAATRSLQGEFSDKVHAITEALIQLRLYIEASIDFAEEEIDFLSDDKLKHRFTLALQDLTTIQQQAKQGCILRDGITIVIAGEPNVGKSTLLNLLSGKESAIVTDIPGTTRDILREHIAIDGIPLHIIDTAGLRDTHDKIEQEGIRRAQKEIAQADLVLYVVDANPLTSARTTTASPQPAAGEDRGEVQPTTLIIRNKIDLLNELPTITEANGTTTISLSAKHNSGIDLLKLAIKSVIGYTPQNEGTFSARQRHLDALATAKHHLETAYHQLIENGAGELIAEDLRQTQKALNEITGEFTTEDLLGRIFSSFCIGK